MPVLPVDREHVGVPRHQQLLHLPHLADSGDSK